MLERINIFHISLFFRIREIARWVSAFASFGVMTCTPAANFDPSLATLLRPVSAQEKRAEIVSDKAERQQGVENRDRSDPQRLLHFADM